ncbi:hypothetical protein [Staphylococcus pseudintermedius]|uniref:hypothetical protein n=1 Tax=Staphylococcus pseudintermedius TaxID=283734 RepID=UPI001BDE97A4|nr:hypothetical protein [Staphylococcus pseudintermedius]HAR6219131.1 hypothetical protein [Staphylococcus pseudintermedius]
MAQKLKIFTKEQEEKMKQNGIPRAIARSRVRRMGWSPEEAVTTPLKLEFDNEQEFYDYLKKHELHFEESKQLSFFEV